MLQAIRDKNSTDNLIHRIGKSEELGSLPFILDRTKKIKYLQRNEIERNILNP